MKKLISITLTIFLLIVAMPISAYAESVVIVSDEAPRYAAAADYSSEAYKEAEERILAGFENLSEEVSLSDLALPKDTFSDFYFTVRENNPQYFYINGHITFAVSPSAQTVVEVYPEYLFTSTTCYATSTSSTTSATTSNSDATTSASSTTSCTNSATN